MLFETNCLTCTASHFESLIFTAVLPWLPNGGFPALPVRFCHVDEGVSNSLCHVDECPREGISVITSKKFLSRRRERGKQDSAD